MANKGLGNVKSGMERSLRSLRLKGISHIVLQFYQSTDRPYKSVDADKGNISYDVCDDNSSHSDMLYNNAHKKK
jgi:hypothetical protein